MGTIEVATAGVGSAPRSSGLPDRDWDLLERVAAGDGRAFEEIVRTHEGRLLALCRRLLGSRAAAEDAVQEVFVKTYLRAGDLEPRGQLYTWLYRPGRRH